MSDDQTTEPAADEPAAEKATARPTTIKAVQPVGNQRLETKQIQGQIITHTIVKPL
ncbi:hypothetical protein ACFP3U_20780 [Kitasatospora misakiensis]|uniref:Uncharacterized protein n=1 Tax=Kitasatospora misakiensis TaxID=67330 RepID=A0ABW0X8Q6_9ACTN